MDFDSILRVARHEKSPFSSRPGLHPPRACGDGPATQKQFGLGLSSKASLRISSARLRSGTIRAMPSDCFSSVSPHHSIDLATGTPFSSSKFGLTYAGTGAASDARRTPASLKTLGRFFRRGRAIVRLTARLRAGRSWSHAFAPCLQTLDQATGNPCVQTFLVFAGAERHRCR